MSKPYPHSDYYRDRRSESELCCDFPGDELLISGLHAMQAHFYNNGTNIEIPIVRVMNTAHFLAAYMFATTCSGDQLEYDALAINSMGHDRRLFKVAIIVLAAMLQRTEGFRARACRNMLLTDRDPDFEEGVTLYDRFLQSAEIRFAEENFLIDTSSLIARLNEKDAIIARQEQTIQSLNNTLTDMNERLTQNNTTIGIQNNTTIGTQNNTTIGTQIINKYYYSTPAPKAEDAQAEQVKLEPEDIQAEDSTQQEQNNLPFLVPKKLEELNLYTLEQFADMYSKAAESDAKTFAMFLKKYRDLKVLDFQGYNKKEIFAAMRNFFPTMRQYSYNNFVAYY